MSNVINFLTSIISLGSALSRMPLDHNGGINATDMPGSHHMFVMPLIP